MKAVTHGMKKLPDGSVYFGDDILHDMNLLEEIRAKTREAELGDKEASAMVMRLHARAGIRMNRDILMRLHRGSLLWGK